MSTISSKLFIPGFFFLAPNQSFHLAEMFVLQIFFVCLFFWWFYVTSSNGMEFTDASNWLKQNYTSCLRLKIEAFHWQFYNRSSHLFQFALKSRLPTGCFSPVFFSLGRRSEHPLLCHPWILSDLSAEITSPTAFLITFESGGWHRQLVIVTRRPLPLIRLLELESLHI